MATEPDDAGKAAGAQSEAPPLVEAKLAAPRVRRGVLDRPRILHALDADAVLTLVGAPAGYGKTTAVRIWCATRDAALAWVTLDAGDNDPGRMWTYVATAVDRIRPGLGQPALRRLGAAGSPIEHAVDELLSALGGYGEPVILVLDDLHAVTEQDCLASLDHALLHVPENVRVIVSTRTDPALALPQLRAARKLTELRASDLAFTSPEAHALLVGLAELELSDEQIDVLVERTEGWPAALVLAGLWLRTVDDPSSAVSAFGGDHRFVADYLSTEVLAALDDDRRAFLESVAVLGQFTPELCDAVLDRSDSAETLAELERANLFVTRLERDDWFRIHQLFAEYAQAQLEASQPGASSRIHLRAATWLRAQGRPLEAIAHASSAGEHEVVAELLADQHAALIRSGAGRTLLRWASTLPDDVLVAHPEIAIHAAIAAAIVSGGTMERRRYLGYVDQARAERPEVSNEYMESAERIVRALSIEGGVARAVDDGRRAVEVTEAGLDELVTGALCGYARALYFAGDLDEARAVALRVLEHPDISHRVPSLVHAQATLALVAVGEERLSLARAHAEHARNAVGRLGTSRSWLGAHVSAAMGVVLAAEGDLAEAERELATAAHFFHDEVPTTHEAWLLALIASVRARRGRLDHAEEALRAAREALAELPDAGVVPGLVAEAEHELAVASDRASTGAVLEAPSEAELAVLRLLATDLSTREIAEELFVSANTVHSHQQALYRKLGVHSREAAIARAAALDLLNEAESPR